MKKNTIILGVDEYNALRDFRNEIEKYNAVGFYRAISGHEIIYTLDDAVVEIAKENRKLSEAISNLKLKNNHQSSIDEIKAMNWWQFRKWKRSNKS